MWQKGLSVIGVVPSDLECLAVLVVGIFVFMPPYDEFSLGFLGDRVLLFDNSSFERRIRSSRLENSLKTAIDLGW